jgi:hypothetical protein
MKDPFEEGRKLYRQEQEMKDNRAIDLVVKLGAVLEKDSNQFCYLLGNNLQEGFAAFGDTPILAARKFYKEYMGL